jgi:hypothetical protein
VTDELTSKITEVVEADTLARCGHVGLPRRQELACRFDAPANDPGRDREAGGSAERMRQMTRRVSEGVGDVAQAERMDIVRVDVFDDPFSYRGAPSTRGAEARRAIY